jgi:hypothetical protein
MFSRIFLLLTAAFALAGCDRLKGGVDQKALDAEAIGYACRVSLKPPEDCMKENDTHSPTSILYGWKEADRDIREKTIDPSMGQSSPGPSPTAASAENMQTAEAPAGSEAPHEPAAGKPADR